jgi:hypothetical protein
VPPRFLDQTRIFVSELLHLSAQSRRFRGARRRATEVVLSFAPVDLDLLGVGHDISPTVAGHLLDTFIGHCVTCSAGTLLRLRTYGARLRRTVA